MSKAELKVLQSILQTDRRKADHSRGLVCIKPYKRLSLEVGDRFEPSEAMWDWEELVSAVEPPPRVLFWRPSAQSCIKHYNPFVLNIST
eukprot:6484577-Amphidinium_carterae.1